MDSRWACVGRGGNSLTNNKGHKPFAPKDLDEISCPVLAEGGKCDTDPYVTRTECQKSYGRIFIDNERYYSEVIGMANAPTVQQEPRGRKTPALCNYIDHFIHKASSYSSMEKMF